MKAFTCTSPKLILTNPDGSTTVMHKDDVLTLEDEQVEQYCKAGWGTAEGVETGDRVPGSKRLDPVKTVSPS